MTWKAKLAASCYILLPTYWAFVQRRCYYVANYHKSQSIFFKTTFSSSLQLWTKCWNIKDRRVATRNLGISFYLLSTFPGAFPSVHTCMQCLDFSCLSSRSFAGWLGIYSEYHYTSGWQSGWFVSERTLLEACSQASHRKCLSRVYRCI